MPIPCFLLVNLVIWVYLLIFQLIKKHLKAEIIITGSRFERIIDSNENPINYQSTGGNIEESSISKRAYIKSSLGILRIILIVWKFNSLIS